MEESPMLMHTLDLVAQAIPNPPPAAPADLSSKAATAIGLVKWISIISALAVLAGAGTLLFAGEKGYGGGISPDLKSKLGSVVVVLLIVGASTQIVQFLA
jgi:hypothetical protein